MECFRRSSMKSCRIITGKKGSGKTTTILKLYGKEKGFVTVHRGEEYFLLNLSSGEETLLLSPHPKFPVLWKRWYVNESAFLAAVSSLLEEREGVVVVDEVGQMEIEGKGFAPFLEKVKDRDITLVLGVRDSLVEDVKNRFFPFLEPTVLFVDRA